MPQSPIPIPILQTRNQILEGVQWFRQGDEYYKVDLRPIKHKTESVEHQNKGQMKTMSDKKVDDYARIYIGCQMMMIDGSSVGDIENDLDSGEVERIVDRINEIGEKILGNRKFCSNPTQILYNIKVLPRKNSNKG
nr:hypothetical protein [uncultured Allomuricauda sp.]